MSPLDRIAHLTYALQHNPNCSSPYLIRLCGPSLIIDNKPYEETADRLCFGETLEEAVEKALS